MKVTLKEFKSLIVEGARFSCVENTYRPQLNGQNRKIEKAQSNGWFWRAVDDVNDAGGRYWTDMPKAADIVESREVYTSGEPCGLNVTLRAPIPGHTITLEFAYENLPAEVRSETREACHCPTIEVIR